jgi:hypothetical protein
MKTSSRVGLYIIVFILLTGLTGYASTLSMSQSQAQALNQQVQNIPRTTLGIYENNAQVALIEFVPVLGPVYGVISTYDTGLAISAMGQVPGAATSGIVGFILLLFTPVFWLEFCCYTLAVEESIAILVSLRNRDLLTREWKWILASILFVVSVLFDSARLEIAMIHFI